MDATEAAVRLELIPSDEDVAIRDSVRRICEGFGRKYIRDCYEQGAPPRALWDALSDAGFTGINVPEEWGGGGLGMTGLQIVIEETAAASGLGSLMMVVSSAIAGTVLARHGTDTQNDSWLRGIATGTYRAAFAITEPDAGTNTHQLRTELRAEAGGYSSTARRPSSPASRTRMASWSSHGSAATTGRSGNTHSASSMLTPPG